MKTRLPTVSATMSTPSPFVSPSTSPEKSCASAATRTETGAGQCDRVTPCRAARQGNDRRAGRLGNLHRSQSDAAACAGDKTVSPSLTPAVSRSAPSATAVDDPSIRQASAKDRLSEISEQRLRGYGGIFRIATRNNAALGQSVSMPLRQRRHHHRSENPSRTPAHRP